MQSRKPQSSLSPVVVSALFLALLAGCSGAEDTTEASNLPEDETSSESSQMMQPSAADTASSADDRTSSSASVAPASEAAVLPKQKYANGTFAATGTYRSPAGSETINISLTLKNDLTDHATYTGTATHPKSMNFQSLFGAGFDAAVTGKSIDTLALDVVNGSSLTPMGFMDALAKIKAEALVKA